jgi:uncharacterized protein YjbJ (UPF0337 family)
MNTQETMADWGQLKSKIASKWSKFADTELESFKGNLDAISEKLQKSYGYTKEKAEQEFRDFKKTLDSMSK